MHRCLMVMLSTHRQRNTAFKHSSVAKAKLCSKALVLRMSLVSSFACLPSHHATQNKNGGKQGGSKRGKTHFKTNEIVLIEIGLRHTL